MSKRKYEHVYSIAFTIESYQPEGEDITQDMMLKACLKRIVDITANNEWFEAAGREESVDIE